VLTRDIAKAGPASEASALGLAFALASPKVPTVGAAEHHRGAESVIIKLEEH